MNKNNHPLQPTKGLTYNDLLKIEVNAVAGHIINKMPKDVRVKFDRGVILFVEQLSAHERLNIVQWATDPLSSNKREASRLYFQVNDEELRSEEGYPEYVRFTISFNVDDGEFCSGDKRYCFVRDEWKLFADKIMFRLDDGEDEINF